MITRDFRLIKFTGKVMLFVVKFILINARICQTVHPIRILNSQTAEEFT